MLILCPRTESKLDLFTIYVVNTGVCCYPFYVFAQLTDPNRRVTLVGFASCCGVGTLAEHLDRSIFNALAFFFVSYRASIALPWRIECHPELGDNRRDHIRLSLFDIYYHRPTPYVISNRGFTSLVSPSCSNVQYTQYPSCRRRHRPPDPHSHS